MREWLLLLLIPSFALAVDPLASQFYPSLDTTTTDYYIAFGTVTMTNSLYKVFQSSVAPGNLHWYAANAATGDGYAMQNEITSFQVHISPSVNVTSLTVSMSNLTNAQTSTVISSATTDIVVYREAYLNIATPTAVASTYYNYRTNMPDPIIPAKDPYYGQKTNAFPVAVTSTMTQSAWFDVHIPTWAPSGYYSGSVYVSSGAVVVSTMPVVIGVWAWIMPSTSSLAMIGSAFGFNYFCNLSYGGYTGCAAYSTLSANCGGDGNTLLFVDGTTQMLDNRWNTDGIGNIFPQAGSFSAFNTCYSPLLNGTAGHLQTILPGASMTAFKIVYTSSSSAVWQNWATNFTSSGWFSKLYDYLCDEVNCTAPVLGQGLSNHLWSTPSIPNLATIDMADSLSKSAPNYVDWMVPIVNNMDPQGGSLQRSTYNTWLSTNVFSVPRILASYTSCSSADTCSNGSIGDANGTWPNEDVDAYPVANRVMEWLTFYHTQKMELYYSTDWCWASGNCPGNNAWTSVYAYGGNGDGTIIYPGTTAQVAVSTPIFIPSIRLKQHRDGMQDYEYMNYLTNLGYGTTVQAQIQSWITNSYTYSVSTAPISTARYVMGNLIHQQTYPPPTPPVKTITGGGQCRGGGTIR